MFKTSIKPNFKNTLIKALATIGAFILVLNPSTSFALNEKISHSATATTNSVTLTAIYDSGTFPSMDIQFEFGTSSNLSGSKYYPTSATTVLASGVFTQTITGLSPQTRYYYRAMGTTNHVISAPISIIDTQGTAQVLKPQVTITSTTPSNASIFIQAFANGNGAPSMKTGFEYGTSTNAFLLTSVSAQNLGTSGNFNTTIGGLTPSTTYYVRAFAENSEGTTYTSFTKLVTTATAATQPTYGCKDTSATNYSASYTYHDATQCTYPSNTQTYIYGCMDVRALNYKSTANRDDRSCQYSYTNPNPYYPPTPVPGNSLRGCTVPQAFNYNPNATINDGSCFFPNNQTVSYGSDHSGGTVAIAKKAGASSVKGTTDTAKPASLLGAAALFGSGFFPQTILGWLLLAFFILLLVVLTRAYLTKKA